MPDMSDGTVGLTVERTEAGRLIFGLSRRLWRLALVMAMAQFSLSLWNWQFGIHLETILAPWQMGLTFTAGTAMGLLGAPASGIVSDLFGRKRTMMLSLVPMALGLYLLATAPVWPLIPFSYALASLGWSFVMVLVRAFPADEIAAVGATDTARRFTMVFVPAFAVDGAAPLIGAALLEVYDPTMLYAIAAVWACLTIAVAWAVLRETLSDEVKERARMGPVVTVRGLGRNFWLFSFSILPFYFVFNMALPYFGNLCVGEWGVSTAVYAVTWSAFSFTFSIVSYSASGLADRAHGTALATALSLNAIVVFLFGIGSGVVMMFVLEIIWAVPIAVWVGTENTFVVRNVDEDKQGRALGTYDVLMRSTGLIAANVGAWIWTFTGSLRALYIVAGVAGLISVVLVRWAVSRLGSQGE